MITGDEAAFLKAIDAAPFDSAPRLVYADWLLDQGRGRDSERVRREAVALGGLDKSGPDTWILGRA